MKKVAHTSIRPTRGLNLLSRDEVYKLSNPSDDLYRLFRECALAVLNTDNNEDDADDLLNAFSDFDIQLIPQPRGIALDIVNAPAQSFVDGEIIKGIQEHLSSVLRDIVYTELTMPTDTVNDINITDTLFQLLRNANAIKPNVSPNIIVCWGGHSIPRKEYDYAKRVGYELGLRRIDIITGCGIGAMKAPMKGAALAHAKQHIKDGRYIGITEPGIIASESPNAIVNELIIMPDIEKRLEAFLRLGHGVIVFPGGVGTVEEILYLLSILLHPDNSAGIPLILAGPECCRDYFDLLDNFLKTCLGDDIDELYQIVIGKPEQVGSLAKQALERVHAQRRSHAEAYYFNWQLKIAAELQKPFIPTHDNMAALSIKKSLPRHELASNLRAVFSGIVAGNVKSFGVQAVAQHGPYKINGDRELMNAIDQLLRVFVKQQRMKLGQGENEYQPCYELV
jgi:predicted Rossmann-fold nucleotide-binding protein